MSGRSRILIWQVCFVLLFGGCAVQTVKSVREGGLTAQERAWLAKAHRSEKNGWIYLHIEGAPFERGFQRGYLTADEIDDFRKTLRRTEKFETAKDLDYFIRAAAKLFRGKVSREYVEEMEGMAAGMRARGKEITYDEVLFLNGFIDISWYWWPQKKEAMGPGCSAFIATGSATRDGKIVMAHNTWSDYLTGRFCNLIVDLVPDQGHRILMQSCACAIYSTTDFFITSAGLMGTETTIGGFKGFDAHGTPVFERARKAMQYADTIDEWADIMVKHNSGAYANSWLLGDTKTNEIACLELGLKHHSLVKKKAGYLYGSNVTDDIEILREETNDSSYEDIRDCCVARRERWKQLMKQYYGKIDAEVAKRLLADHFDMYLGKEHPGHRTICGHCELDDGHVPGDALSAYYPSGAVDGKVVDSRLAQQWRFWAKWGSSCDRNFIAREFLRQHTQYDWMEGYLQDLPAEPWTLFPAQEESVPAAENEKK